MSISTALNTCAATAQRAMCISTATLGSLIRAPRYYRGHSADTAEVEVVADKF